jgi:hypothetical protein
VGKPDQCVHSQVVNLGTFWEKLGTFWEKLWTVFGQTCTFCVKIVPLGNNYGQFWGENGHL